MLLSEFTNQTARNKVIFMAGSPGSGKTTIMRLVTGDLGFRVIDTDAVLVRMMKVRDNDVKIDGFFELYYHSPFCDDVYRSHLGLWNADLRSRTLNSITTRRTAPP